MSYSTRAPLWDLRAEGVALRDAGIKTQYFDEWLDNWDEFFGRLLACLDDAQMSDVARRLRPLDYLAPSDPRNAVHYGDRKHQLNVDAASSVLELLTGCLMTAWARELGQD